MRQAQTAYGPAQLRWQRRVQKFRETAAARGDEADEETYPRKARKPVMSEAESLTPNKLHYEAPR